MWRALLERKRKRDHEQLTRWLQAIKSVLGCQISRPSPSARKDATPGAGGASGRGEDLHRDDCWAYRTSSAVMIFFPVSAGDTRLDVVF